MMCQPNAEEFSIINRIHQYHDADYIVFRLSQEMLSLGKVPADGFMRTFLQKYHLSDLSPSDDTTSIKSYNLQAILGDKVRTTELSILYGSHQEAEAIRVQELMDANQFRKGDLVYLTVRNQETTPELALMNLSHQAPSEQLLAGEFGRGNLQETVERLAPSIAAIMQEGFHPSVRGTGEVSPQSICETFDFLLKNRMSDQHLKDFITVKTKSSEEFETLFSLKPHIYGDRTSLSANQNKTVISSLSGETNFLLETDGSEGSTASDLDSGRQEQELFDLFVNEDNRRIELIKEQEPVAYWTFKEVETALLQNNPTILWIEAENRMNGEIAEFEYAQVDFTRNPQLMTVLLLVRNGGLVFDFGKLSKGRSLANLWRLKSKYRYQLFGRGESLSMRYLTARQRTVRKDAAKSSLEELEAQLHRSIESHQIQKSLKDWSQDKQPANQGEERGRHLDNL